MHKKTIILDVDGVLLNWVDPFVAWVKNTHNWTPDINFFPHAYNIGAWYNINNDQGASLIEEFNGAMIDLDPLPGAIFFIQECIRLGYHIHFVTACGSDNITHRIDNLISAFNLKEGQWSIHTCHPEGSKSRILDFYEGSNFYYVEDHIKHALVGSALGLQSILVNTPQNEHINVPDTITRISSLPSLLGKLIEHPTFKGE